MDPKRVEEIYKEIEGYSIELEEDPTTRGQRYIQEKVAKCRNYLNSISKILLEIRRENREVAHQLRGEKAQYDIEFETILATNPQVQRLSHIEERKATINVILAERRKRISDLEIQLDDLKVIEKVVVHRHDELKGTNQDIKAQARTMRDELDTGMFYGVDVETSRPAKISNDINEEELAQLLSGAQPTLELQAKPEPPVELISKITPEKAAETSVPSAISTPSPASFVEDPEIEAFLNSELPTPTAVSTTSKPASGTVAEQDFSDVFSSL